MAWTQQLPSGKWRGLYRDNGKPKSAGTFVRKTDAKRAAERAEHITRNDPNLSSDITLKEWVDKWWPSRTVTESTLIEDKKRFDKRIHPYWGNTPIRDITTPAIQDWVTELRGENLSASTITKHGHNLSAALKAAVAAKLIPTNPCIGVTYPKQGTSPERYLTREETDAVELILDGTNLLIWHLLLGTGMRWGEAAGLHWDHINLDKQRIEIAVAWDAKQKQFKSPKNYQRRYVPLGDTLQHHLETHLDQHGYGQPPAATYTQVTKPRYGLVLPNRGLPVASNTFGHLLSAAGKAAHIGQGPRRRPVGHIRPHDLRHTYASWQVQAGVPLQQVQKLLGHSSLSVTERYARISDTGWQQVRDALR